MRWAERVQAAFSSHKTVCRVGTCCPRVAPRQPENAWAISAHPTQTSIVHINF